ncbi:MAG: leucine-rich repeat domain-containing protein [Prevotella sp.]|nr:leucine-rich repeat domain-containing protein [Prevotella sp.]
MKRNLRILAMVVFAMMTTVSTFAREVGDTFYLTDGDGNKYYFEVLTVPTEEVTNYTAKLYKYVQGGETPLTVLKGTYAGGFKLTSGDTYNVTEIGDEVFKDQVELDSVGNAASLVKIGKSAFEGCSKLRVFSPKAACASIVEFGDRAFYGCEKLFQLGNTTNAVKFGTSANTGGKVAIGNEVFKNCSSIVYVSNNTNVISIGEGSFENCTLLGSTDKGAFYSTLKIETIPANAFKGCERMNSATFSAAKEVGSEAFLGVADTTIITLPYQILSEELFNSQGVVAKQMRAYVSFSSGNYLKVISCKVPINLNSGTMEVKYVKSVTESSDGVTVETEATPTKALPSNTALLIHYIGTGTAPYWTFSVLSKEPSVDYTNYLEPAIEEATLPASDGTTNYYTFATTTPADKTEAADFNTFKKVVEPTTIDACSGYLKLVNGTPTAIRELKVDNPNADVYYDLNGVRVDHPKKGIYIRNGKKVVVK